MTMEFMLYKNLRSLSTKEFYFSSVNNEDLDGRECKMDIITKEENFVVEEIDKQSVVLLINELNVEKIMKLEEESDPYEGKVNCKVEGMPTLPFYLYYEKNHFISLIQNSDISTLCQKYRIVILVGINELEDYFCQLDIIYPTIIKGDKDGSVSKKIKEIIFEKEKIFCEILSDVQTYYSQNGDEIEQRVLENSAKICVLKYSYEPKRFQEYYEQFKCVLESQGYNVEICAERGTIFRTPEILNIFRYRPDIIFQINKSRDGGTFQGESIYLPQMENLIFVNWLQDIYPAAWNIQYALKLGKKDFIFSLFEEKIMKKYGFLKQNMIYKGIMPANNAIFCYHAITEEEHKSLDYDICFFGTLWDEEYSVYWIYQELQPYIMDNQIERVCELLFELLGGLYEKVSQRYITKLETLNNYVDQLQKEFQCDDIIKMHIFRVFMIMRYNTLRKLVLVQLASQRKYKIVLYGPIDVKIEGVDYGGFISNQELLSKAIQCCKICMQINPDMTINQRVAEGILSRTVVMIYRMEDDDNMSDVAHYLSENEGICFFSNKKELIEKCDLLLSNDELRKDIINCGYQRASRILTTDYVFDYLMEKMKQKIRVV